MSADYDKATEKSESQPKGHAQAVKEAMEDAKHPVGHPAMQHAPATMPSHKMAGGPGGAIL
jgi:hypothetical protein